VNRWRDHIDVMITMQPLQGGQDGQRRNRLSKGGGEEPQEKKGQERGAERKRDSADGTLSSTLLTRPP